MENEFFLDENEESVAQLCSKVFTCALAEGKKCVIDLESHVNKIDSSIESRNIEELMDNLEEFRLDLFEKKNYLPKNYGEFEIGKNLFDFYNTCVNNDLSIQLIRVFAQWTYQQTTEQEIFANLYFFKQLMDFFEASYETIDLDNMDGDGYDFNCGLRTDILYLFNNIITDSETGLDIFVDGNYLSQLCDLIINNFDEEIFQNSFVQLCEKTRMSKCPIKNDTDLETTLEFVIEHIFSKLDNFEIGYHETVLILNFIVSNNTNFANETLLRLTQLVCSKFGKNYNILVVEAILGYYKQQLLFKKEMVQICKIKNVDEIIDESFDSLYHWMNWTGLIDILKLFINENIYQKEYQNKIITLILDVMSLAIEHKPNAVLICSAFYDVAKDLFEKGSYQVRISILNLLHFLVRIESNCWKILEIGFLNYFEAVLSEFDSIELLEKYLDIIYTLFSHSLCSPLLRSTLLQYVEESEFFNQLDIFYYQSLSTEITTKLDILYSLKAELYDCNEGEDTNNIMVDTKIENPEESNYSDNFEYDLGNEMNEIEFDPGGPEIEDFIEWDHDD